MLITPSQLQLQTLASLSAGWLAINTVGEPGIHGATVAGTHGMGVKTPIAAAVAEATVGFEGEEHTPKGIMFTSGLWSMMFAAGTLLPMVRLSGGTTSADGVAPNEH